MGAPKFVTMRLGKDSVQDIRTIDVRPAGIQSPAYELTIVCKQVPRNLKAGTFAILWLGSDNSKGAPTDWKQGLRAIARVKDLELGEKHNDDSVITVSIGYIFGMSIDKIDLIDNYAIAYKYFAELPLVGLSDYSNQTVREVDEGPRKNIGALIAACGKASASSLNDLFSVYPELASLVRDSYGDANDNEPEEVGTDELKQPRNLIYFGAPGTGKSHELNKVAKENFRKENISRVTFYPDYTYSQFVGCFKPVTKYENADDAPISKASAYISYEFVPGPFLSSYVKAVQNPDENYLLIVEEINRANPAAVFGDVFQLLDRKATGESEYEIAVPREMQSYLEIFLPEYATTAHITEPVKLLEEQERLKKESGRLALPSNLYIWATMNSADQGVFPMDTAFKRRWDFRYIGIDAGEDASVEIDGVMRPLCDVVVRWGKGGEHRANWNNLRKAINDFLVSDKVKLNEDKLLGPFFVKPEALTQERFAATFKDKVLLYLYEDACKTKHSKVFASDLKTYSQICNAFDERGVDIFVDDFKKYYSGEADDGSEDDGEAEE